MVDIIIEYIIGISNYIDAYSTLSDLLEIIALPYSIYKIAVTIKKCQQLV